MAVSGDSQREDIIIVNVSGAVFEVRDALLKQFPNTLLGSPTKRLKYFDSHRGQYFFDRHRQAFEAILFFYQSGGRINRPENVPEKVFVEEINYFDISEEIETVSQMYKSVILGSKIGADDLHPCQRKLWEIFEFPHSSSTARSVGIFSQFIIILSLVTSWVRTVGYLQNMLENQLNDNIVDNRNAGFVDFANDFWSCFDMVCYGWFTLECAVRFCFSPRKGVCFQTWVGIIDILTIAFFYVLLIVKIAFPGATTILNVLETLCVVRMFKLLRYSGSLQIVVSTFISGARELQHLILFVFVFILLSSSAVYYAELDDTESNFTSIPSAFWWSAITITTTGYGDMVPVTVSGKVITGLCAIFGTLIIALPLFRFAAKLRMFLISIEDRHANR